MSSEKSGKYFGFRPGVLDGEKIKILYESDIIKDLNTDSIGLSSFDLRLSDRYWVMDGSVKPIKGRRITDIFKYGTEKKTKGKVHLKTGYTYIFKIIESVYFGDTPFYGKATGRSTIGRLDVLTRLIVEQQELYDFVTPVHYGSLYLEVTPITFPIIVGEGTPMSQLRVFLCEPDISEIGMAEREIYLHEHILDGNYKPIEPEKLGKLTLNLNPVKIGGKDTVAFSAVRKSNKDWNESEYIDLTRDFDNKKNRYDPTLYWEREEVRVHKGEKSIEITPESFYILRSNERFSLPGDIAVYCRAVTEELGEIRIHYAGFVHPYFGSANVDKHEKSKGAPLIFEVRGHNVKAVLRDGERLANLRYYKMSSHTKGNDEDETTKNEDTQKAVLSEDKRPPENRRDSKDSSDYDRQELKLSKVFKDWPDEN